MSFYLSAKEGNDYLTLDYEGFRAMMINKLKERLPEYTDFSETDMGVILIELTAHGLDILSYYKDRQALECFLPTARERKNVITHCKMFGYTLDSATPAMFLQVFDKPEGGIFEVKYGDRSADEFGENETPDRIFRVKTKSDSGQTAEYFEIIGEATLDSQGKITSFNPVFRIENEKEPDNNGKYHYFAVVISGVTIPKEIVGYSDGSAYQKYTTSQTPAMDYVPEITLYREKGEPFSELVVKVYVNGEPWTRVDNFLLSNATSKHYTYTVNEYGEGTIEFGNDISGMIPPVNAKIQCTYRIGGGESSNVGANTITELVESSAIVTGTHNPNTAFVLGADMESIEEAKVKAPASLRTLDRAVTIRDYADIGLLVNYIQSTQSALMKLVGGEQMAFVDKDDKNTFLADTAHYKALENAFVGSGLMYVWLMPKNAHSVSDDWDLEADPVNGIESRTVTEGTVYISDENMQTLTEYYDQRRMVGQHIAYVYREGNNWTYDRENTHLLPANIHYVKPVLKVTRDLNYTAETVVNSILSKMVDLLVLGKYKLEQDLIWSDLIRQLVDENTGVTGLKSAAFVEAITVNDTIKYYIADDIKADFGYVFALKPLKPVVDDDENITPYYDITIIINDNNGDSITYNGYGEIVE